MIVNLQKKLDASQEDLKTKEVANSDLKKKLEAADNKCKELQATMANKITFSNQSPNEAVLAGCKSTIKEETGGPFHKYSYSEIPRKTKTRNDVCEIYDRRSSSKTSFDAYKRSLQNSAKGYKT